MRIILPTKGLSRNPGAVQIVGDGCGDLTAADGVVAQDRLAIGGSPLLPSFGTVGDGLDNANMESFWSSMQVELLNRKRRQAWVELTNAIFECIELFHDRQRRHSALGYRSPIEYELLRKQSHPRCQVPIKTGTQTVGQIRWRCALCEP